MNGNSPLTPTQTSNLASLYHPSTANNAPGNTSPSTLGRMDYSTSVNGVYVPNGAPGPSSTVASTLSAANNTSSQSTVSPVVTSQSALEDFTQKLAAYKSTLEAMGQQQTAQTIAAQQKAANDLQVSSQKFQEDQANQKNTIDQTKANADLQNANTKSAALTGLQNPPTATPAANTDNAAQPSATNQTVQNPPAGNGITPSQNTQNYAAQVQGVQDERSTALNTFLATANSMIVGLQSSESALVQATTSQFNNILANQAQSNAGQEGAAREAAARTGQEYNPIGANSTIANVISQGNQRLSDINSKMATTIADLDMAFAKEQYSLMNSNFEKLDKNFQERLDTFKDVHDAVAIDAAAQLKAQTDARDFDYKKGQDEILNNLNSNKFTYQQKQDAIDNAFKTKQISETQRHNLAQEAAAKDPTPAQKKATEKALQNAATSAQVAKDKISAIDAIKDSPGMNVRVGTSFLSRVPTGEGVFGSIKKGAENVLKAPLTGLYGTEQDIQKGLSGAGNDFAARVHLLQSGLTLDSLIESKARGATFGALSDSELNILANSASKLNDWEIKNDEGKGIGVWNIDENSFKQELDRIKTLTNRALSLSGEPLINPDEQKELDSSFPDSEDPSKYY